MEKRVFSSLAVDDSPTALGYLPDLIRREFRKPIVMSQVLVRGPM